MTTTEAHPQRQPNTMKHEIIKFIACKGHTEQDRSSSLSQLMCTRRQPSNNSDWQTKRRNNDGKRNEIDFYQGMGRWRNDCKRYLVARIATTNFERLDCAAWAQNSSNYSVPPIRCVREAIYFCIVHPLSGQSSTTLCTLFAFRVQHTPRCRLPLPSPPMMMQSLIKSLCVWCNLMKVYNVEWSVRSSFHNGNWVLRCKANVFCIFPSPETKLMAADILHEFSALIMTQKKNEPIKGLCYVSGVLNAKEMQSESIDTILMLWLCPRNEIPARE